MGPGLLATAGLLAIGALLLLSAGQPILAEDTWLHLALGRFYLAGGPWLDADPLLHTATGPPAPAAWLFGVALRGLEQSFGLQSLRVAHAAGVACILALAWRLLWRASRSPLFASLGTSVFAVLSAYRLFQLRPHLFTIFATLLTIHLLIAPEGRPSWRRVAIATGLFALWANLHGGFVIGLALLGAAAVAQTLLAFNDPPERPRATRLLSALALALLATLLNPSGADQLLLYFAAGAETPALTVVQDEWARVSLFALPIPRIPPSPLAWGTLWALLLAMPAVVFAWPRPRRRAAPLLALTLACWIGALSAVRLLWLAIGPLLAIAHVFRAKPPGPALSWTAGLAAVLLVPAFFHLGDWPMISRGLHRLLYAQPYAASKLDAHAVWFLRDAGLEGNLYNDYATGNFLGYWLAPRMKTFVNGSLNVPLDVMDASTALRERTGAAGGSFGELLDRHRVDVFFGTGLPLLSGEGRPRHHTTTHLENEAGWLPVFRSARSALYLRRNERNARNLERVVAYYESQRVPFDVAGGFDAERVIARASRWAVAHGVAPFRLKPLESALGSLDRHTRGAAQNELAELHALLGSYERALTLDRGLLAQAPRSLPLLRRRLWCLLHQRREESLAAAAELEAIAPDDPRARLLVAAARSLPGLPQAEAAALVARLPLFGPGEAQRILGGFLPGEARLH